MKYKPLLLTHDLIEKMKIKGIVFERIDEESAMKYLKNNNYYFKLASYRKNYDKQNEKYYHLDFAYLKDLVIVDMELRYVLIHLSLDIEHYAKLKLINKAEEFKEDGYAVIQDYIDSIDEKQQERLESELFQAKSSLYSNDLFFHYEMNHLPIWVFLELIPFGSLVSFYSFCSERYNNLDMKNEHYILKTCKEIRNACAHSSCILNNLHLNTAMHKTSFEVNKSLYNIERLSKNMAKKKMSNARLQEIVTLLYAHNKLVASDGVHSKAARELSTFVTRMNKNLNYYQSNDMIKSSFSFLYKVIEAWYLG